MSQLNLSRQTLKLSHASSTLLAEAGELVLLRGETGSGKTTWLKRMARLIDMPADVRIESAETVRMLFDQQPPVWLGQNVGEEICFGLKHQPDPETLNASLQQWGLSDIHLSSALKDLNRLQAIRLTLAGITLAKPALALLDAPTDALSVEAATLLIKEISQWAVTSNTIVVVAANRWHDWQPVASQIWITGSADELPQVKGNI
ncbi:MAG: ABC transporter ATP-binding protein [Zetaproteobacteria bacterium CG_4_9_14_3_um_filter_53_7]|nr:MAG: ABC transporter ATP-binding protein [Zetaproteobacteria bacterium CG_4_9_14_3_um_filter_53_7]